MPQLNLWRWVLRATRPPSRCSSSQGRAISRAATSTRTEDAQKQRENAWLLRLQEECHKRISPRDGSAIYAALYRGGTDLTARCQELEKQGQEVCGRRTLALNTDLVEGAEEHVAVRIREVARRIRQGQRISPPPSTLPHLQIAEDVEISICGVVNTQLGPGQKPLPAGVLERVWGEVVTGQRLPACEAGCAAEALPVTPATAAGGDQ